LEQQLLHALQPWVTHLLFLTPASAGEAASSSTPTASAASQVVGIVFLRRLDEAGGWCVGRPAQENVRIACEGASAAGPERPKTGHLENMFHQAEIL